LIGVMEKGLTQTLFDTEPANVAAAGIVDVQAGKSVIEKLLKVRRSLSTPEQMFGLPRINALIDEMRSMLKASDTRCEDMILYSIERQGATTETEIAEDTRIHRKIVDGIVADMLERNILYKVSRTVIGSDRPQFALKSRRVKTPEAS